MKRMFFIISILLTVILVGCSTVPGLSVSSSESAIVTPMPGQISPSSITSPPPSPTDTMDPIENMFNTPDESNQEIGQKVISNGGSIYYFSQSSPHNYSISILDIATQISKVVLSTKKYLSIEEMFLDHSGNLYYRGEKSADDIQNESSDIIKYDGNKQSIILRDVADIYKVDNNYIYFSVHNSDNADGLFLKKYDLQTSAIEDVRIDGNGYIIPFCIFQNKPIMLYSSSKGTLAGPYYICNLNTGIVQEISSLDYEYSISLDQKSIMFYKHDKQYAYVNVYSMENEFSNVNIKLTMDQITLIDSASPFFDSFICNSKELQFIIDNYYYVVEVSTGKLLEKIRLIDDKDYASSLPISCRILNGIWYVLVQKPLAFKPSSDGHGDGLLVEVQPTLYTIDIASHELKCIWKADSYKNNDEYAGLDFLIQNGYICLYVPNRNFNWRLIPISDMDKGQ